MLKPNLNSSYSPANNPLKPFKNTQFQTHNFQNYQSPANHYKENFTAHPITTKFSFQRFSQIRPSSNLDKQTNNKYDDNTLMNSRLEQIRKKYENKSRTPNDYYEGPKTPLKDSKISNSFYQKYSNPQYKKQYKNQSIMNTSQESSTITKSFSFLNNEKQKIRFEKEKKPQEPMEKSFYNNRQVKSIKSSSIKEKNQNNQYKRPQLFDSSRIKQDLEYKRNQLRSTSNTWTIQEQQKRFQAPVTKTMNDFVKNNNNGIGKKYQQIINEKARPVSEYERIQRNFPKRLEDQNNKIDSINKINHKIKGILNFMNQNEKQYKRQQKFDTLADETRKNQRDDRLSYSNYSNMMDSKLYKARNNAVQSKFQMPETPKQKKLVTAFIKKNIDVSNPNQLSFKTDNSSTILTRNLQKKQEKIQYSTGRSFNKKETSNTPNKQYKLSNGKDLDQQIKKIQEKIKKSEDDKKRINMKFEQIKNRKTPEITEFDTRFNNKSVNQRYNEIRQGNQSKSIDERVVQSRDPNTVRSIKKNIMNSKISEQKYEKSIQIPFFYNQNKYDKQQFTEKKQIKNNQTISNRRIQYTSNSNKNQKTDFRIVPIPCQMDPQHKEQTKRLTKAIQDQVVLDEKFRNSKIWFQAYGNKQKKWQELKQALINKNICMGDIEIKSQFQNSLEQHNPFYKIDNFKQSINVLIENYIETNNFWKNKLVNKFNALELSNENFKEQVMDLQRKGYLTLQDFVRFLNIETGTFYRNRDLILIFRRLTKQSKIRFEDFIEIIARKQF